MESFLKEYSIAFAIIVGVLWLFRELIPYIKNGSKELQTIDHRDAVKRALNILEEVKPCISDLEKNVKEMHDWHNVVDEDGVKVWYVRRSLENTIKELSTNIARQASILEKLLEAFKSVQNDFKSIKKNP